MTTRIYKRRSGKADFIQCFSHNGIAFCQRKRFVRWTTQGKGIYLSEWKVFIVRVLVHKAVVVVAVCSEEGRS